MPVSLPVEPRPVSRTESSEAAADAEESVFAQSQLHPHVRPWLIVLAVLPFLAIPTAHLLSDVDTATGLFHYELPYYVANGRAALERGNGVLYPNPYDPSVDAPVIYTHWLPEMVGIAVAVFGADPGSFVLWLTFAAAVAFAAATQRLVAGCLPREQVNSPLSLIAVMWGGGLLAGGSAVSGWLVDGQASDLLSLDPGNGLWFLNWGRNALFPTEAVYHALVACCWLAELRHRRLAANVFLLLLATTHPWSGLELLLTINLWRAVRLRDTLHRADVLQLFVSVTFLAAFLAYYKVWLPTFEQHAALQEVWQLDWNLGWSSAVLAWGPVALAAWYRLWKDPSALRSTAVRFLLCALLVAAGLSLHDRVIQPVQPLHFTRGYVWMPLFLLGAPAMLDFARRWWNRPAVYRIALCGMGLVLISDNLLFGAIHCWRQYQQRDGFHLDVHDRALFAELGEKYSESVVLTESLTLNYLLPAYVNHRPWLGHQFNTPSFPQRLQRMQQCFAGSTVRVSEIPQDVTLLVVRLSRDCQPLVESGRWFDCGAKNARWSIWMRLE